MSQPRNPGSVDIKRIMRVAVLGKINAKKDAALDMGIPPSVLSHYMSPDSDTVIPADLVALFCASVGDLSIAEYIADQLDCDLVPRNQALTPPSDLGSLQGDK